MAKHGARLLLRGLEKVYDEVVALHPTELEVEPGEFFSLIGPSGSGKSTLLGTVAGFIPPTAGSIEVDDVDIVGLPPYRRNIGMVFQNYALFPHLSVFDNIAFPLRLRKLSKPDIEDRVARMLTAVRLPDMGRRMPSQLSGGQQQRVALARAAIYDPHVLLMDEPLGALDKNLREEMQYEIKTFHGQITATIIYVTHDQDEAATMSDRIAIMDHGRIVQVGAPRELYEHPRNAFVASFLGDANLFDVTAIGTISGRSVTAAVGNGFSLKASAERCALDRSGDWVICVRPESVTLCEETSAPQGCGHNVVKGKVVDAVYTAGNFRYRIEIASGATMIARMASVRRSDMLQLGATTCLVWPAADTLLIPKE